MGEAAPLFETPAAPRPQGGSAEWFEGADGAKLRAALFPPTGAPRGSVVLSPGRTEAIEKYFETVENLRVRGFAVLVHDWRGQGLSQRLLPDRLAGHAAGFADFLADYQALLAAFAPRLPGLWVALGHSMGGCLTLLALATGERRFSAAILSAPMLGLSTGNIPRTAAQILSFVLSRIGAAAGYVQKAGPPVPFETNVLTHDRARYERNEYLIAAAPDLALGPPTWGWLDFAFSATSALQRGAGTTRIAVPVTIVTAGDDLIVDNAASRLVAGRLPLGRQVEIPGAFHEILQETDEIRAAFFAEFDTLVARAAGPTPA